MLDDVALGHEIASALRARDPDEGARVLGKYRIEARADSEDGIELFDATRMIDGRWVTVEMPAVERCSDFEVVDRFARTARAEGELRHRAVLTVLDVGTAPDGRPCLAREAIDTEPLAQLVAREGALPWRRVRGIALQLCAGVIAARSHGLVPRDLSLVACRRVRGSGGADEVKLGALVLLEDRDDPDERADVRALVAIVARLLGRGVADEGTSDAARSVAAPSELWELLARAHTPEGIGDLAELSRALSTIGKASSEGSRGRSVVVATTDAPPAVAVRTRDADEPAVVGTIVAEPEPEPEVHVAEVPAVVICTVADAPVAREPEEASIASPAPSVIVDERIAVTPEPLEPAPMRGRPRRGRWIAPWVLLGAVGAAAVVHVVSPQTWPRVIESVQLALDQLNRDLRGTSPTDVAASRGVATAEIGTPSDALPVASDGATAPSDVQRDARAPAAPQTATTPRPASVAPAAIPSPPSVTTPPAMAKPAPRSHAVPPAPPTDPVRAPAKRRAIKKPVTATTTVAPVEPPQPQKRVAVGDPAIEAEAAEPEATSTSTTPTSEVAVAHAQQPTTPTTDEAPAPPDAAIAAPAIPEPDAGEPPVAE